MIECNSKESWTFWQKDEKNGIGEPAILVEKYSDTVCLTVEDNVINLNYDTLNELIRLLTTIKKQHDQGQ